MFIKGYLGELRRVKALDKAADHGREAVYCDTCGYPTLGGRCGYCWTLQKLKLPYRVEFEEYG